MQYKAGLKVGFPKNLTNPEILFTYQSKEGPKKLTYMPPVKKIKEIPLRMPKTQQNKDI